MARFKSLSALSDGSAFSAVSKNRLDSSRSSHLAVGLGLRGMNRLIPRKLQSRKKNTSCGSSGTFDRMRQTRAICARGFRLCPDRTSCFVSKALPFDALQGHLSAPHVINAATFTVGIAEIKFTQ